MTNLLPGVKAMCIVSKLLRKQTMHGRRSEPVYCYAPDLCAMLTCITGSVLGVYRKVMQGLSPM